MSDYKGPADRNCSNRYPVATFDDVVGQDRAVEQLRHWAKKKDRRGGILLWGPDKLGNFTLARLLVKAIFCESPLPDGSPCSRCVPCCDNDKERFELGHVTFDAAATREDSSLRRFLHEARNTSFTEKFAIIIENMDRFEPQQSDIFLKTLEEPDRDMTFILLAKEFRRVRPAIRSRCQSHLALKPLSREQAHELAKRISLALRLELGESDLLLVAKASQGLPSRVLDGVRRLGNLGPATVDERLHALGFDWPAAMIAYWRTVLDGQPDACLREDVVRAGPAESMRRLRVLVNYLFGQVIAEHSCRELVEPALRFVDERAWKELIRQLNDKVEADARSRDQLWRVLAAHCLSSDHEDAADAIIAATAAAAQLRSP